MKKSEKKFGFLRKMSYFYIVNKLDMNTTINKTEAVKWLRANNRNVFAAMVNSLSRDTMVPTKWVADTLPTKLMRELECNVTQTLKF